MLYENLKLRACCGLEVRAPISGDGEGFLALESCGVVCQGLLDFPFVQMVIGEGSMDLRHGEVGVFARDVFGRPAKFIPSGEEFDGNARACDAGIAAADFWRAGWRTHLLVYEDEGARR